MKKRSILINRTIILGFAWIVALVTAQAQTDFKPAIYRGVAWADDDGQSEVYLVQKQTGKGSYSLLVIAERRFKIFYRTEINSSQAVVQELLPVKTAGDRKYYQFDHHFSRTTIWMALEFKFNEKRVEMLTRTFYGNIFETVPNDQFLDRFPTLALRR
jgi:hypothetical protein